MSKVSHTFSVLSSHYLIPSRARVGEAMRHHTREAISPGEARRGVVARARSEAGAVI